jgi:hypothetical protein
MKPRKAPKNAEPSLRDKLSENFLGNFQADFEANGAAVIEQLRLKSPEKYAEIAARLIAATEPSAKKEAEPNSTWEIGRNTLMQVGCNEHDITDDMIEQALAANDRLVAELQTMAAMKASFDTAEMKN